MPDQTISSNATGQNSRWLLLLAVALSVTSAGALFTIFTVNVQADAVLPRPASTLPPTAKWADSAAGAQPDETIAPTHRLRGIASWYGSALNGHPTANGEPFDMYAMTACHPTLPFGTLVRVVNLANKKSVVVRINDRGPLVRGRIIDLSYAAAQELNMTERGIARVALEIVSPRRPRHVGN
jgi:rare lipoprotein A